MSEKTVVYLHGFASSNQGEKAKFIREKCRKRDDFQFEAINFNPTPVDFRLMSITGMIHRLRQFLWDHQIQQPLLVGSSLGGLVSLQYASRYQVRKTLLLAPLLAYQSLGMSAEALSWWEEQGEIEIDHYAFPGKIELGYQFHRDGQSYQDMIPPEAPTLILHGRRDERVPVEDSRYYAEQYPSAVQLVEVDSDHRLGDQHEVIWDQITSFLLSG